MHSFGITLCGKNHFGSFINGNGKKATNLGVYEHWNNPVLKQYSRNLGEEEGIELVYLSPTGETKITNVEEN